MELHVTQAELISLLVWIFLHILTGVKTKIQHNFYEVPYALTLEVICRAFGVRHDKAKGGRFTPTGGQRSKFGANRTSGGRGPRRRIRKVLGGWYGLPKNGSWQ